MQYHANAIAMDCDIAMAFLDFDSLRDIICLSLGFLSGQTFNNKILIYQASHVESLHFKPNFNAAKLNQCPAFRPSLP